MMLEVELTYSALNICWLLPWTISTWNKRPPAAPGRQKALGFWAIVPCSALLEVFTSCDFPVYSWTWHFSLSMETGVEGQILTPQCFFPWNLCTALHMSLKSSPRLGSWFCFSGCRSLPSELFSHCNHSWDPLQFGIRGSIILYIWK